MTSSWDPTAGFNEKRRGIRGAMSRLQDDLRRRAAEIEAARAAQNARAAAEAASESEDDSEEPSTKFYRNVTEDESGSYVSTAVRAIIEELDDSSMDQYMKSLVLGFGSYNPRTGEIMQTNFNLPAFGMTTENSISMTSVFILGAYLHRWSMKNRDKYFDGKDDDEIVGNAPFPVTLDHVDCVIDTIIEVYTFAINEAADIVLKRQNDPEVPDVALGEILMMLVAFDMSIIAHPPVCVDLTTAPGANESLAEDDELFGLNLTPDVIDFLKRHSLRVEDGLKVYTEEDLPSERREALEWLTERFASIAVTKRADLRPAPPLLVDKMLEAFCAERDISTQEFLEQVNDLPGSASRPSEESTGELSRPSAEGAEAQSDADAPVKETSPEEAREAEIQALKNMYNGSTEEIGHPAGTGETALTGVVNPPASSDKKKVTPTGVLRDFRKLNKEERMRVTLETTKDFRDNARVGATEALLLTQECVADIPAAVVQYREKIRASFEATGDTVSDAVLDQMAIHYHAILVQKLA